MKIILISLLAISLLSCSEIKPISEKNSLISPQLMDDNKDPAPEVVIAPEITKPPVALPKILKTLTFANSEKVNNYCKKIDRYFKKYRWGKSHCEDYSWNHVRSSHLGNPIVWFTIGDEKLLKQTPQNTTLILCGVHGDEITPIKFCFDILKDLKQNPQVVQNKFVIIAPIVTPDSFFKKYPTRTNARGVDVNRNFPTKDWKKSALKMWKHRYSSDKRRYPGKKSLTEQETIFQVNLIKRYNPNKILSVHSPLTLIDYDGPEGNKKNGSFGQELLIQMSNKAGKYRINNYPFFPGSLGNYAGNERHIPTYTLELPNSDWTKTKRFYKTFRSAIHHAIDHGLRHDLPTKKISNNESDSPVNETVL